MSHWLLQKTNNTTKSSGIIINKKEYNSFYLNINKIKFRIINKRKSFILY